MTCLQGYQVLKAIVDNDESTPNFPCKFPDRLSIDAFELHLEENNNSVDFQEDVICFIIEEKVFIPVNFRQKWSHAAFSISVMAIIATISISISSFIASKETGSSSIFSCGFDSLLESVSSLVVIWRFRDSKNGDEARDREKIATLGIAMTFLLTGTATITASVVHFSFRDHPNKTDQLIVILICSSVAHMALSNCFFYISKKLDSSSLRAEAVDNGLACAMSIGILICTVIYRAYKPGLWWLDHAVAMLLGVVSLLYGIKLIVEECGGKCACAKQKKKDQVEDLEILFFSEQI